MISARNSAGGSFVRAKMLAHARRKTQFKFSSRCEWLVQSAEEVDDQHDEKNCADDSEAAASAPSGISVVAASSAKQEDENDNEQ